MPRFPTLAALLLGATACGPLGLGEDETPAGPPRCEPDPELTLERHLKAGWRAVAERQPEQARALFDAVLAREPGHPEALRGLALLDHPAPCDDGRGD
jgi:hypothetical protein